MIIDLSNDQKKYLEGFTRYCPVCREWVPALSFIQGRAKRGNGYGWVWNHLEGISGPVCKQCFINGGGKEAVNEKES